MEETTNSTIEISNIKDKTSEENAKQEKNIDSEIIPLCKPVVPTISFLDFKIGDVALFVPIDPKTKLIWMAFHHCKPNRYLAEVND